MHNHKITILLIEDNQADARLTVEALKDSGVPNELKVITDGEAALEYLRHVGDEAPEKLPDIILMDLNLPRIDGRQLLSIVKKDRKLKNIPIIVLTTSSAEKDIILAYDAHCNCYLTKPVDFEKFAELIDMVKSFWLSVVRLPRFAGHVSVI